MHMYSDMNSQHNNDDYDFYSHINIKSVFFTVSVYFISRTNLILEGVSVIHILFGCLFVLSGDIKVLHVSVQSGGNSDTRQDTHDWSQDQHQTDHDTLQNI